MRVARALIACPVALLAATAALAATAVPAAKDPSLDPATFKGLAVRSIGPALTSGRVSDIAVDPTDHARYFVAAASGGVWRTENGGTTWTPVFDDQGSYSIGCVTLDPANPDVVWVGTGENNSQRSVGFGDGVYRSRDGGEHWEHLGLKSSEHIARIVVDPRDSDVVYVASQGPLWRGGGERGLYKTTDGGKTWARVLFVSDDTGVTDLVMDPRNPDVLLAAAYQRRRHVWTLIDGGPESAIYKSEDAGASWRKVTQGLPEVDLGRIGLALAPSDPDRIYAIVEAARDKGGIYRSDDRGESWTKRSDYMSSSPQYYNELFCDPLDRDRVYSMDTFMHVTSDGGVTWEKVGETFKHVDNHALWIDPDDTSHLLAGCDGGVYETHDRGATWAFAANLPITQFYKIAVDTSRPFYFVYGGTQDNATLGGPTRTTSVSGIVNSDWFVTVFGDGFQPRVDPEDPDVVYSQWQYGGLVRYDRRTGETQDIQPQEHPGETPNKWNWDSPLIISPHSHTRLYFASQRVYRSDDRGDSWREVSPDLTRDIDRNALEVMGRLWGPDAVAKSASTSFYGNVVALDESPLVEGLLYAGTDDGLVQISGDGGESWRAVRSESIGGVPERAYVSRLVASRHDADTVYAAFDNHKMGDFAPYLEVSSDRGRTWRSLRGDLPDREVVYALAEDPKDAKLLFLGTEFGAWFSRDDGAHWVKLTGGMPTVAVRDLALQEREGDLVLGTFGRGFYILDDYGAVRTASAATLAAPATLFGVRDALRYVPRRPLGLRGKGMQGDGYYTADNTPFGALITYYLGEKLSTRAELRREAEKDAKKPPYPTLDELRSEAREEEPKVILEVKDDSGAVVSRIEGPRDKGFHRVAWDLRYPPATPVELEGPEGLAPWDEPDQGPLALAGTYTVSLAKEVDGTLTSLAGPVSFDVVPLEVAALPDAQRGEVLAFRRKVARLRRAVSGAVKAGGEAQTRLGYLEKAVLATPGADQALLERIVGLRGRLDDILLALRGDRVAAAHNEPAPPSIQDRVERIVGSQWYTNTPPTVTQEKGYEWAAKAFGSQLDALRQLAQVDLKGIEDQLEAAGAPWTPGRLPTWQPE